MSTRLSRQPGPGQESLFTLETALTVREPHTVVPVATEGASVSIAERAYEIGQTIKAINVASSRAGFQLAAATPHRGEIERRYGSKTDQVVDGASRTEVDRLQDAKQHFAHAAGMASLIKAGYTGEAAAETTRHEFTAFTALYGVGVTNAKVRNAFAKKIQTSADFITGKVEQKK